MLRHINQEIFSLSTVSGGKRNHTDQNVSFYIHTQHRFSITNFSHICQIFVNISAGQVLCDLQICYVYHYKCIFRASVCFDALLIQIAEKFEFLRFEKKLKSEGLIFTGQYIKIDFFSFFL